MKIISGLGNPGPKYETTRHNVGFLAIDRLIDRWKASGPISKYQGEIYQTTVRGEAVYLVKPKTFMNLSGQCIGPMFGFYRCKPDDLIVIHDDLALPSMAIRLKTGGGTGGHNGLKSIDECIGKEKIGYHRIRIGIGHPSMPGLNISNSSSGSNSERANAEAASRISPADYVLQAFRDDELKALDKTLDEVAEIAELVLRGEIQTAMNKYHRKPVAKGEE